MVVIGCKLNVRLEPVVAGCLLGQKRGRQHHYFSRVRLFQSDAAHLVSLAFVSCFSCEKEALPSEYRSCCLLLP